MYLNNFAQTSSVRHHVRVTLRPSFLRTNGDGPLEIRVIFDISNYITR